MASAFTASQYLNFGLTIPNPRIEGAKTYPWSLNLLTDMPKNVPPSDLKFGFEIVGVPTHPPLVGEYYQLAIIFERASKTTNSYPEPMVDAVWVKWEIGNGPAAFVTATDTFSLTGTKGVNLETSDPLANNWHVKDWTSVEQFTCEKIESEGCDVLTAKIYKYWHEYNTIEDFDMSNDNYMISLYTKKCSSSGSSECETEQYNKEVAWFFDTAVNLYVPLGATQVGAIAATLFAFILLAL